MVRTVACESLAELSWVVWNAEDSETSQQRQGARRAEEMGRRSQARQLIEQQDESEMPAQGQQQQEYQPQPQQYADWFPLAEQFFRNLYQGAYQPGQAAAGVQFPVPPPAVPEQPQVELEVEQPERQQRSGTGSTRAGRRRTAVTEDRTALLEKFLRLRPPMFHGEYDPDKAESWTHELERIFETMECVEEDQVRLAVYQLKGAAHEWWRVQRQMHFQGQRLDHITWQRFSEVFHGEYFPDYTRRERRDQFHPLVQGDLTVSQYHQRFVSMCLMSQAVTRSWRRPPPWTERPGSLSNSSSSSREEPLPGPHLTSIQRVAAVVRLPLPPARAAPAAPGFARSLGSLLARAVGAGSRSASPGLQSSQLSRELSRAVRRQFATLVAYRATSGGIAPWGKPRNSIIQCSTLSSRLSTSETSQQRQGARRAEETGR
ncbi:hypothetical protein Taro_046791 [Colocasia esculenta]|uniref:Retrotransposon gag domain-containing protein n=1 Tax=Colocasia esculenta TaxID=4460 RepID=A0A843X7L8_COLES|nr:hypothetical protein [Colocasia esculenta]